MVLIKTTYGGACYEYPQHGLLSKANKQKLRLVVKLFILSSDYNVYMSTMNRSAAFSKRLHVQAVKTLISLPDAQADLSLR